ncbi:GntR family transcriptional regulator [Rhodoligotrophos defluvii]|uniref:GntR family transcriptional regulator n=1 Tax=Rhodoligotrophos defluvii TaxID=2561934 RepID=UPI0010C9CAE7|nr:GntR family transcriptional regulator [Rhodoligotrophos defluvii]
MTVCKRSADVVDRVYATLQEWLADFAIRPAERINEVELAAQLGVSRTPVREALNRLTTEGLVIFAPNRGFFCRSLTAGEITALSELRQAVEGVAAARACQRAGDEPINALAQHWSEILARMDEMSAPDLAMADEQFHQALVGLAGNAELDKLIRNINLRLRFVRQCAIEHPRRRRDTAAEHLEIIQALKRREAAKARATVERHVRITPADAADIVAQTMARMIGSAGSQSGDPPATPI